MKRIGACCLFVALVVGMAMAAPVVSDVSLSQDPATRLVTVEYTLSGGPAIVTLDVLTNGVSVGAANIVTTAGDVNRRVEAGENHRLTWRPDYGWDGNLFDATAKLTAWPLDDPPDWLVASVRLPSNVQYYVCAEQVPWGVTNNVYKTRKILMRRIHAAGVPWNMGAPSCEPHFNRDGARETIHTVVLTNDFYIGVYELTQAQYYYTMGASTRLKGANSNYGGTDNTTDWFMYPQQWLGYETLRGAVADYPWPGSHAVDPSKFLGVLRARTGIDFDLPLDAQWEFAARGGCPYAFHNGYNMRPTTDSTSDSSDAHFDEIGWFRGNSAVNGTYTTHPVGLKKPNAYGLYDMLGNLSELCLDKYQNSPTGYDPNVGLVSDAVAIRCRRGGSAVNYDLHQCRAAYRDASVADTTGRFDMGVRLCWTLAK